MATRLLGAAYERELVGVTGKTLLFLGACRIGSVEMILDCRYEPKDSGIGF